jgi:hypothetical protein
MVNKKHLLSPRLVHHLRRLQGLDPVTQGKVKSILSGKWAEDPTAFEHVGRVLKRSEDERVKALGQAYNWGRMHKALLMDYHVKDWLDNTFAAAKSKYGDTFYQKAKAVLLGGTHKEHADFMKSLTNHVARMKSLYPPTMTKDLQQSILNSVTRLGNNEADSEIVNVTKTVSPKYHPKGIVDLAKKHLDEHLNPLPLDSRHLDRYLDPSSKKVRSAGYSDHPEAYSKKKDTDYAGNTYHQEFLEHVKSKGKSEDEVWDHMSSEFHYSPSECKEIACKTFKWYGGSQHYEMDYETALKYVFQDKSDIALLTYFHPHIDNHPHLGTIVNKASQEIVRKLDPVKKTTRLTTSAASLKNGEESKLSVFGHEDHGDGTSTLTLRLANPMDAEHDVQLKHTGPKQTHDMLEKSIRNRS